MQRTSTFIGLELFLLILRTFRYIPQVYRRFSLMADTLSNALNDISAFIVLAGVNVVAFALFFHYSLGGYFLEFSTIWQSGYMILLGVSALWDPAPWYRLDPVTSSILVFLFTCLISWLTCTIIIAIFTEAFVSAKKEVEQRLSQVPRKQRALRKWCKDASSLQPISTLPRCALLLLHPASKRCVHPRTALHRLKMLTENSLLERSILRAMTPRQPRPTAHATPALTGPRAHHLLAVLNSRARTQRTRVFLVHTFSAGRGRYLSLTEAPFIPASRRPPRFVVAQQEPEWREDDEAVRARYIGERCTPSLTEQSGCKPLPHPAPRTAQTSWVSTEHHVHFRRALVRRALRAIHRG